MTTKTQSGVARLTARAAKSQSGKASIVTINPNVPNLYDVAINGHGYMLDTKHPAFGGESAYLGRMGMETIPLIRQQADAATEPGESTINPEDLWPRTQTSWHKGMGQNYLDSPQSDRSRYRTSIGLDPWTKGQLKQLNSVRNIKSGLNSNVSLLRAGSYLYQLDGQTVKFFTDYGAPNTAGSATLTDSNIQSWAGSPTTVSSIATDGSTVYAALGSNGVATTALGSASSASYNALVATSVAYVKGRLMAANNNAIYNITSGTTPTALFTHPNTSFTWVGFAEGTNNIYMAGYSGTRSVVYRTAIKTDGTSLDAPVVAGGLPYGEVVTAIVGYAGYIIVGTTTGFRVATQDSSGNLTFSPDVNLGCAVRCFEPQGRFVWFGWDNFTITITSPGGVPASSYAGLGRMDLSTFTDDGVPAYATDVMAGFLSSGHTVTSVVTEPGGLRTYSVYSTSGRVYQENTATLASPAVMQSGQLSFGIPDEKMALRLNMRHKPFPNIGTIYLSLAADNADWVTVGSNDVTGSVAPVSPFVLNPPIAARLFEIQVNVSSTPDSPVIFESYDFRAWPVSNRSHELLIPVLLYDTVTLANGSQAHVDTLAEYLYLDALISDNQLTYLQELGRNSNVIVEDLSLQKHHAGRGRSWWNGTLLLKIKEP